MSSWMGAYDPTMHMQANDVDSGAVKAEEAGCDRLVRLVADSGRGPGMAMGNGIAACLCVFGL
ncbi:hypothetical protein SLEP1_g7446 [Rubroshorea leprosula]|uniref:Uncharacterized protein n=1 Tax=Rubroshorea leprosula TaxID=152421 RepID=A0AAV5HYM1_9ROSI|nr:hypothetical protein SLEP1_g7446 [Rubroshorea leprosula]